MKEADYIFMYSHMNDSKEVGLTIPNIANQVMDLNYGQQRMLAEILRLREASEDYNKYEQYRKHTKQLRDLLESGWY